MEERTEKTYPCDAPAKEKRAYPCDDAAEKRQYPCDTNWKRENTQDAKEEGALEKRRPGKGRRGGNAAASVVVRSGKAPEHPDYSKDRYQLEAERAARDAWSSIGWREDGARFGARGGERRGTQGTGGFDRGRSSDRRDGFAKNRGTDRAGSFERGRSFDRADGFDRSRRSGREEGFEQGRSAGRRDGFAQSRSFDRADGFDRSRRSDRGHGFDRERSFDRERRGSQSERSSFRTFERGGAERSFRRTNGDSARGAGRQGFRTEREPLEQEFVKPQKLTVLENTPIGAFLDFGEGRKILLPFAEQTKRPEVGEELLVWLYADKGGRMTATMRTPILKTGELGVLKVAEVSKIGLFLDNGVPKQLLVPFREQVCTPKAGEDVLVYAYTDKTGRAAATMRVYKHLSSESPYQADDKVQGFVYEVNPSMGVFVAVDNKYFGLIPQSEVYRGFRYGEIIEARVVRVREDGKLDLSVREKAYAAIEQDAEVVLYEIKRSGGRLNYADKADAEFIEETYAMSKNQFKRALGHLYKMKKIRIDREQDTVQLIEEAAEN